MLPDHNSEHVHYLTAILKQIVSTTAEKDELKAYATVKNDSKCMSGAQGLVEKPAGRDVTVPTGLTARLTFKAPPR